MSRNQHAHGPDKQTNRNSIRPANLLALSSSRLLGLVMQLGALSGLHDGEDNGGDEGADELREGGVDVENTKVDAGELARGRLCVAVAVAASWRERQGG